ncbi:deoxyuridine 5'-triphosphate nucleotidohydrolase [Vibrio phage vB_VibM_83AMN]|nr:deoxyuridine 5'-triphosphate nucleotidohydrolase [Vibrio phage vB_VibM_83AMN]
MSDKNLFLGASTINSAIIDNANVIGINFVIGDDKVEIPKYETAGSACFDIKAHSIKSATDDTVIYGTGLFLEIPEGYNLKCYIRSGLAFKQGFRLVNSVAVIDSDYRGELLIGLIRQHSNNPFPEVGDRICQGEIQKTIQARFMFADELSETDRGEGGIGSTGK